MVCLSIKCFDTTINKKIINRFSQHYKYNVKIVSIFVQKVQNWWWFRWWGPGLISHGLYVWPPLPPLRVPLCLNCYSIAIENTWTGVPGRAKICAT